MLGPVPSIFIRKCRVIQFLNRTRSASAALSGISGISGSADQIPPPPISFQNIPSTKFTGFFLFLGFFSPNQPEKGKEDNDNNNNNNNKITTRITRPQAMAEAVMIRSRKQWGKKKPKWIYSCIQMGVGVCCCCGCFRTEWQFVIWQRGTTPGEIPESAAGWRHGGPRRLPYRQRSSAQLGVVSFGLLLLLLSSGFTGSTGQRCTPRCVSHFVGRRPLRWRWPPAIHYSFIH